MDGNVVVYSYKVTGGNIVGKGASVVWDLTNLKPGNYSVTVRATDRSGKKGSTLTKSVKLQECPDCDLHCICPDLSVTASKNSAKVGEVVIFSANVSGLKGVKFKWNVENGTIVRGKNSKYIQVRSNSSAKDKSVTATVEIGGTDPSCNCVTMASALVEIKQ